MNTAEIRNTDCTLYLDEEHEEVMSELSTRFSYFVEGSQFTYFGPRTQSLLSTTSGSWSFPTGILCPVLEALGSAGIHVTQKDLRGTPAKQAKLALCREAVPNLRGYQRKAVDAIKRSGRLCLHLPTRSGKTIIAAAAICEMGLKTLFLVCSDLLMRQAVSCFSKVIKHSPHEDYEGLDLPLVGQWSGDYKELGFVTVVSVQALLSAHRASDLGLLLALRGYDVAFFDECHHLDSEMWGSAFKQLDCRYKIGLSATIRPRTRTGRGTSHLELIGNAGPIEYSLTPSDLIEAGWLCRPRIRMLDLGEEEFPFSGAQPWPTLYKECITENELRNRVAVAVAGKLRREGQTVLMTCQHVLHAKRICEEAKVQGFKPALVIGTHKPSTREKRIAGVAEGTYDMLVGTVFQEGVDLPWLDAVVVCDGSKSFVSLLQRLRNLTPYDKVTGGTLNEPMNPSKIVNVFDFMDRRSSVTLKHSRKRLSEYSSHPAFIVETVKL